MGDNVSNGLVIVAGCAIIGVGIGIAGCGVFDIPIVTKEVKDEASAMIPTAAVIGQSMLNTNNT